MLAADRSPWRAMWRPVSRRFPRAPLRAVFVIAAALLVSLAIDVAALAADIPYLTGRVVDNAEVITPPVRRQIEALLKAHESATGDQIAILTTPTLGGETIEQYAQGVFAGWKLGQKGKDNGILVVVAPSERKMRIEVGYGLEGTLPDVIAARIIRNIMTPPFKAADYDGGVLKGAQAIVAQLEGRGDALHLSSNVSDLYAAASSLEAASSSLAWPLRIVLGCFSFSLIGAFTYLGIVLPAIGWFFYFFLIPFYVAFPSIVLGPRPAGVLLMLYLIGFPVTKLIVRRRPWYAQAVRDLKSSGRASVGGIVLGSDSGSGSGNGSGGGGFSGGGGSSGGGGASGSW